MATEGEHGERALLGRLRSWEITCDEEVRAPWQPHVQFRHHPTPSIESQTKGAAEAVRLNSRGQRAPCRCVAVPPFNKPDSGCLHGAEFAYPDGTQLRMRPKPWKGDSLPIVRRSCLDHLDRLPANRPLRR
jgi:hypothetical protein